MTTNHELLPVSLDFVFKLIFGDQRNADVTQNFLSAVLNLPDEEFVSLKFINTELKRKYKNDKLSVLDVRVETAKGTDIAVEIQVAPDKSMAKRALHCWSEMFATHLKKSQSYEKQPRTIAICILNFNLFEYSKYHSVFQIREDTENIILTDLLRIDFLELKKITSMPVKTKDLVLQWLHFINTKDEGVLQVLSQQNPMIEKAVGVLKELSADEQIRLEAQYRQRAIRDHISRMESSRAEGIEIGREEGEAIGLTKGKLETAANLLTMGLTIEQIKTATGLTEQEILALKQ